MSLFRFVRRISEGRPLTLYGDGTQSRDFTYVDDIARGTIAGLKALGFEVINLGSDRPVVLIDAIRLIEKLVGRKAEIVSKPRHPADVPATWADVTRAWNLLGWEGRVKFEDSPRVSGVLAAGSFGAQYAPHERFRLFGEVGLSYSPQEGTTGYSASRADTATSSLGLRSGVGVVVYF